MTNKTSIIHNYDAVKAAIENANSIREVLDNLGLRAAGGNYKALKQAVVIHGLELPIPNAEVFRAAQARRKITDGHASSHGEVFCENSTYTSGHGIKRRLRLIWETWVCADCGISEEWNGKPLTLQLDHKNGVHNDNRLENLRLLCPNCHSQTDTFAGRRKRTIAQ